MTTIEFITWALTAVVTLMGLLVGTIWKMQQTKLKEHDELIRGKADMERVHEIEARLQSEQTKLEMRQTREMDQMAQRLGEQIRNSETNILTQIRLMIQVIQSKE